MWSYYGAKTMIAGIYPPPKHGVIIEPFAGSARYALEHWQNDVVLVDKFARLVDIWHYLQQATPREILSLPDFGPGDRVDDHTYCCPAQRDLVGFIVGYGLTHPANKVSDIKLTDRPHHVQFNKKRIADNLHKIRHWKIICDSYENLPDQSATWFVDPPYQHGGRNYSCSNRDINFVHLSEWCRSRSGQVIVCENIKADWLPFNPLKQIQGAKGRSTEAIWSNEITSFDHRQLALFQ